MSAIRYLVDTNILLRFLSGEPPAQAAAARKLFGQAAKGEVILDIPTLVVAEAYYTLTSFYEVERKVAAGKLSQLLQQPGVKLREASPVLTALGWLQTSSVGFSDAYLAAAASEEKLTVASFDADIDKLRVVRHEPAT